MGRILLVEDDEDLVATLREVLSDEGYVVATASSGEEAVLVARGGATLAFVDLHIEGELSGQDLIAALRQALPPDARLYLLSGERDLGVLARELGADGYLEKPFGVDDLLRLLHEAPAAHPHA